MNIFLSSLLPRFFKNLKLNYSNGHDECHPINILGAIFSRGNQLDSLILTLTLLFRGVDLLYRLGNNVAGKKANQGEMESRMTRVYLVRHGTTDWNKEEIFRGRVDCQINATGQAEANALAAYLGDVAIDVIYSSPLSRAMETARAIAGARGLRVISEPAFVDINFGEWHGLPLQEVKERYSGLYRLWREQPHNVTFPGGENLAQVRARAWQGLMHALQENQGKTLLIVSHRVITKVLICAVLGLDDSHFWQIKQDTTAVNCFEHTRGIFITSLINDTCHLKSIHAGTLRKDF